MKRSLFLLFILISILIVSCKNRHDYPYAIRDFRKIIQLELTRVVTRGYVDDYDNASLWKNVEDKELRLLSKCEHPILRASALIEMLHRKSFNHFDVIMNHLDDTAYINIMEGEFGIKEKMVSDVVIEYGAWENLAARNKTLDVIITRYNYLSSAYFSVAHLAAQEKYYPYIKEMAQRDPPFFYLRECALYALAKFKKKDDIPLIKAILLKNAGSIGYQSFRLMKEFPDESYFEVFDKYYPWGYNLSMCVFNKGTYNQESFIETLASYKNERSAAILDTILNKTPFLKCPSIVDSSAIAYTLIYAIWNNDCLAYGSLRQQVSVRIMNEEKDKIQVGEMDKIDIDVPKEKEPVSWRNILNEKDILL